MICFFVALNFSCSYACWIPVTCSHHHARCISNSYGHTCRKAPGPVRSLKLSRRWRGQYCGGRPRGNTACRSFLQNGTMISDQGDTFQQSVMHFSGCEIHFAKVEYISVPCRKALSRQLDDYSSRFQKTLLNPESGLKEKSVLVCSRKHWC
jgi:hypothetical protein